MKGLIFSSAICLMSGIAAFANTGANASAGAYAGLDFSRKGYDYSSVSPVGFLTQNLNSELFEGEAEYLEAFPDFTIKYSDKIAGRYVSAAEENGELNVAAEEYAYTAANGSSVVWTPISAEGVQSQDGSWNFPLSGLANDYVSVTYGTTIDIDKSYINDLLNSYYRAAQAAASKIQSENDRYDSAYAEYQANCSEYENYLAECELYKQRSEEYAAYLERYAEWKRKDDPYQAYLKEYNKYLDELEEYNSYNSEAAQAQYNRDMQRYLEYQAACENYEKLYDEYLKSIDTPEMAQVKAQIGIVDYIYKVAGDNRTIYGAITGSTVTDVLSRKEDLKLAGADGKAVDRASDATKNLRNLFANYAALKNEEAKYSFYVTTYSSLSENFNVLLRVLDYFYRINTIRTYIEKSGRNEKFCILVAQLYEITDALSSAPVTNYEAEYGWKDPSAAVFDGSYKINGRKPADILGSAVLDFSGSPEPLGDGYPLLPSEPEKPEKVDPPVFYERPHMPVPPVEVPPPGPAPEAVSEPVKPDEVPEPEELERYQPTHWESVLSAMDGKIGYRQPVSENYKLSITSEVTKYFRGDHQSVTVFFYPDRDAGAEEYSYFEESVDGSYIEYPPDLPTPEKTRRGYVCTFAGWVYEDGTPVDFGDLRSAESSVNVYPSFTEVPELYDVIWVIDGVEYPQKAAYDSIPRFEGEPQKPPEGMRQYRFNGWDRDIEYMSDSTVYYYAQFEGSCLITWRVAGSPDMVVSVWKDEIPVYPENEGIPYRESDSVYAYVFSGWDMLPAPATKDEVYTATFARKYLVPVKDKWAVVTYADGYYSADCLAAGSSPVDISLLLNTAVMHGAGVRVVCGVNYTVTFTASEVYDLVECGVASVEPFITVIGINAYRGRVIFFDDTGAEIVYSGAMSMSFSGSFDKNKSRMYRTDGQNGSEEIRFSFDGNNVIFTMRGNGIYEIYPVYTVNVINSDAAITVTRDFAKRNDIVTVSLGELPEGRQLEKIYVIDSAGNPVALSGDMSFIMPAGDVAVSAVLAWRRYEVIFRSDGKTISRRIYNYGDDITPPANPVKAPDGTNSYSFVGWDAELSKVTKDVTYNAVFQSMPLPVFASGNGGLSKLAITLICVAACVFAVIVAAIVLTVVLIVRRKKRKNALKPESTLKTM